MSESDWSHLLMRDRKTGTWASYHGGDKSDKVHATEFMNSSQATWDCLTQIEDATSEMLNGFRDNDDAYNKIVNAMYTKSLISGGTDKI
jgi:hypothetical protein